MSARDDYPVLGRFGDGDHRGGPHSAGSNPAGAPPLDWHLDNTNWTPTPNKDAPMPIEYRIGDVFDRLAEIPDASIDLIVTSPPFLALRSYLPVDHPDKAKEIGSEATPAHFIDTLLALTAEFGRVLAPHGSICVELGDTFSGSGGGDAALSYRMALNGERSKGGQNDRRDTSVGWPLAKSLTGIPTLYPWSLAYGRNLLTGQESTAGRWRIRNIIVWARPNPPVGALGDKFRPATSYITVACRGVRRFFDLDAVRGDPAMIDHRANDAAMGRVDGRERARVEVGLSSGNGWTGVNAASAPPLDHPLTNPEDGDWLWKLSTQPYKGAHYATFPLELPTRLIMAMCPLRVCVTCGKPSERITEDRSAFDIQPMLAAHIKERRESVGVTSAQINERLGYKEIAKNWERTDKHGAAIPNADDWAIIKPWLGLSDEFDAAVTGERRWTEDPATYSDTNGHSVDKTTWTSGIADGKGAHSLKTSSSTRQSANLGWSDCGHNTWRTGVVLDPFGGSGTVAQAAQNVGRHAILIDVDERNAELARNRVGMFLEVTP